MDSKPLEAATPVCGGADGEVTVEEDRPEVPQAFCVEDEKSANWVVLKITQCRAYRDRVDAWAAREKARAQRDEDFFLRFFGRQLEGWTSEQVQKLNGRRKSICVPAGTLGFRRQQDKIVIDNEKSLIVWAKKHVPAAIEIVEKLHKTPINEYFAQTGEIPPDCHLEQGYDKFYIS